MWQTEDRRSPEEREQQRLAADLERSRTSSGLRERAYEQMRAARTGATGVVTLSASAATGASGADAVRQFDALVEQHVRQHGGLHANAMIAVAQQYPDLAERRRVALMFGGTQRCGIEKGTGELGAGLDPRAPAAEMRRLPLSCDLATDGVREPRVHLPRAEKTRLGSARSAV